jgi:branched-chain amino acid transport system substrate-binding protein
VTSYDFNHESIAYQNFLVTYRNQFGEDPTSQIHAFAFDAARMLLKVIAAVAIPGEDGSLQVDPLAVRDALYRLVDFPGLTGRLTCSPLGECASITEGRIYQFTSGDPTTFNPGPASSLGSNPAQVWP